MGGFRDTSKTMSGHGNSPMFKATGGTINRLAGGGHFAQMTRAAGAPTQREDKQNGMLARGSNAPTGHAAVQREPNQPTEELKEHGGKSPLTAGYKKGGKAGGFHVHKHYHLGGAVKTVSQTYGAGNMQKSKKAGTKTRNGGFPGGGTGRSRPKLAAGGSTGETRNPVKKGGGIHIKAANKGKFTKKMTGSKSGHLTGSDVKRGLDSSSPETRKEANFARMARRGFKKLARGGGVGHHTHHIDCETGPEHEYAQGGHIHDNTKVVAPNYAAGGALYARGGRR